MTRDTKQTSQVDRNDSNKVGSMFVLQKKQKWSILFMTITVEDIHSTKELTDELIEDIKSKFKITDLGNQNT